MKTHEGRRTPAVDVLDTKEAWTLVFDLPGCTKEDVELTTADGKLTLEAHPRKPDMPATAVIQRRESAVAAFGRTIVLDVECDATRATARLDKGVLTLTIPKRVEAAEEKRIRVE
ncbi:MAG: Hsp20/alpha crystallin family protein [Planctomycetes bacterium]|nr:Hsp20/alpha crystallin family protein [Planctomycetota bacterium]